MHDLQTYQFYSKFSRWIPQENRRETWTEAVCDRIIPWLQKVATKHKAYLKQEEWSWLKDKLLHMQASPALRVIQLAGPALDRCNVGVYNCSYIPLIDLRCFAEMLYVLMQGTGVGFSVEEQYISNLPRVKPWNGKVVEKVVVEDTTEGWCDALLRCLEIFFDGYDVELDTHLVRPKGSILKTKGGYASGPEPLRELINFTRNVISSNGGHKLRDTDVHRIACFIGRIVQVGGVRRAALISLSDLHSLGMRFIKSGEWWNDKTYWDHGLYLSMANNSAVYDRNYTKQSFIDEWEALRQSGSGERGIFNRDATRRLKPSRRESCDFGTNPCGEIVLRPFEFCNLSIAVARQGDTTESLVDKVRAATYFGVLQSLCTDFNYIRSEWKRNCEEERLLGVDITGQVDCELLRYGISGREALMRKLKEESIQTARMLAQRFGINIPKAITTVKPSGDSAVLFGCSSGVHPRYARFYRRWVRESKDSPMCKFLVSQGVPHAPAPEAPERLMVFCFPVKSPEGVLTRNDLSAIQQLENWLAWRENYTEHSVSCTVYVGDNEWDEVGEWVWNHMDSITGVSFLPRDNGTYKYAPNEEITEDEYMDMMRQFPKIDWSKLREFDQPVNAQSLFTCSAGGCSF